MKRAYKLIRKMIPPVMVIVITMVMSVTAYNKILNMEEDRCWGILESTSATINNEIKTRFKDNITILRLAANAMVQEKRVKSYGAITQYINAFQKMTIFNRIDLVYPDNTVLLQTGERVNLEGDSFEKIAALGEHMSLRRKDIQSDNEIIYYSVPVVSNGETQALLVGVIDCKAMPELFKTSSYDGKAFNCLVDCRDGSFIQDDWHETLGNIFEMKPREQLKGYEDVDLVEDVRNGKAGVTAYKSAKNGKASYMYYTPVGIFDWELLIVVQEDVAFASLLQLKRTFMLLGIIEAILMLIYFVWTLEAVNQLEKSNTDAEEKRQAFEILSYEDTLTKLYNRNKYNQVIEAYVEENIEKIGVAFFDLNGLKQVNDEQGHKAGDLLLQNAAKQINSVFPGESFRIGGDEFIVIALSIEEEIFYNKISEVKRVLQDNAVSISVGAAWKQQCSDFNELLKEADQYMYDEKKEYYKSTDIVY